MSFSLPSNAIPDSERSPNWAFRSLPYFVIEPSSRISLKMAAGPEATVTFRSSDLPFLHSLSPQVAIAATAPV